MTPRTGPHSVWACNVWQLCQSDKHVTWSKLKTANTHTDRQHPSPRGTRGPGGPPLGGRPTTAPCPARTGRGQRRRRARRAATPCTRRGWRWRRRRTCTCWGWCWAGGARTHHGRVPSPSAAGIPRHSTLFAKGRGFREGRVVVTCAVQGYYQQGISPPICWEDREYG